MRDNHGRQCAGSHPFRGRLAALVCTLGLAAASAGSDPEFGSWWHDGRAEIDGYRWTVSRYGESRSGQAVMIFVTEPFSQDKRVKVDDPARNPADTFDALKLNLVRDFQTGIYDYNTMTSVFVRSEDFEPVKISFSSTEWCGNVYEELRFDRRRVEEKLFSYFEGESATRSLDRRREGISGDDLFILLRGLRGPYLEPGSKLKVPFLAGAFHRRLAHRPLDWTSAEIERRAETETVAVPAGNFTTTVYVVRTDDGRQGRFLIEQDYPHRVIRWEWSQGGVISESGELSGTTRVKYWKLHSNDDERYLEAVGLRAPADAMPPVSSR